LFTLQDSSLPSAKQSIILLYSLNTGFVRYPPLVFEPDNYRHAGTDKSH